MNLAMKKEQEKQDEIDRLNPYSFMLNGPIVVKRNKLPINHAVIPEKEVYIYDESGRKFGWAKVELGFWSKEIRDKMNI